MASKSAMEGEQQPLFSLPLRGGRLDLWSDRITIAGDAFQLTDLVQAALVPYATGVASAPAPGLLLRGRDGRAPLVIPEDVARAQQFLEMVYARRPDLRPVPPPYYVPYPPYGAFLPPYPQHPMATARPGEIPQNERIWAMVSHLSVFFLPLWLPLIVWLVTQQSMPYASRQAKQAFFFHLIETLVTLVLVVPLWAVFFFGAMSAAMSASANPSSVPTPPFFGAFFVVWVVMMLVSIATISLGIYAAVQAYNGKPFHYPLLGRL